MKAAIIGASEEALHTIEKAHELGLEIVALDGNPKAAGLQAADRGLIVDISDEKKTIEAVNHEKVDFVLTVPIGRYLTTIGAVNDALHLPGISKEMASFCTDKYLFHQKLQENHLRKCKCLLISALKMQENAVSEIIDFDSSQPGVKLNYPTILKPRYGSGSRGIYLAQDKQALIEALGMLQKEMRQDNAFEDYVLEECVPGEEYGVDGVMLNGKFQMILLRHKENTPFPARQAVAYFSVLPKHPRYESVRNYMEQVTKQLGLDECLLHADLILDEKEENRPFVIELSARPSGHNLHNLFTPLCTGIDEAECYIRRRMGQEVCFEPKQTRQMMIHYFDLTGCVKCVPTKEEVQQILSDLGVELLQWNCHLKEGEILKPAKDGHSLMPRGFYIVQGENEQLLEEAAVKIKEIMED